MNETIDWVLQLILRHNVLCVVIVALLQLWFVLKTYIRTSSISLRFPSDKNAYSVQEEHSGFYTIKVDYKEQNTINSFQKLLIVIFNRFTKSQKRDEYVNINDLVNEINSYLCKNVGTSDFSIIQNKCDRFVQRSFNYASATMAFPVYLGLMGTFLGVIAGLHGFRLDAIGDGIASANGVSNLIGGVLVSMITSFSGLVFTTYSHSRTSKTKKEIETKLSLFYDFFQTELQPSMGTSIVSSLELLRKTITEFEPSFSRVIKDFRTTFQECTSAFGNEFRENVTIVADAVKEMGEIMPSINEVIINQQELMNTMKTRAINETLKRFVNTVGEFDRLTDNVCSMQETLCSISKSTQDVTLLHEKLNLSMKMPASIIEGISNIMDRIIRFENSINALGDQIEDSQLLANREINLVNSQLNSLLQKDATINRYSEKFGEMVDIVTDKQINQLKEWYETSNQVLLNNAQDFEAITNNMLCLIKKRNAILAEKLEEALSVKSVETNLNKLGSLDLLIDKIGGLLDESRAIKGALLSIRNLDRNKSEKIEEPHESSVSSSKEHKTWFSSVFGKKQ